MIDESVGILQTESHYLKVSKQSAIQILIERGYQAIREDFERVDREESEQETVTVSIERTKQTRDTYDMKAYAEMSNKTIYEPRKSPAKISQNEKPKFLQNLGLR
jgi:hypothetical protein